MSEATGPKPAGGKLNQEMLLGVASAVDLALRTVAGRHLGFSLLVFEFGQPESVAEHVTNANGPSLLNALRQTVAQLEQLSLEEPEPPTDWLQ